MPRTVLLATDRRTGDFSAPYWPVECAENPGKAMSADNDTTEDRRTVIFAKSDAETDAHRQDQCARRVIFTETPTVIIEEVEITVILR